MGIKMGSVKADRVLGGAEDLLLDANEPHVIQQDRDGNGTEPITKIYSGSIPHTGKFGEADFVSIAQELESVRQSSGVHTGTVPVTSVNGTLYHTDNGEAIFWDGTQYIPLVKSLPSETRIGKLGDALSKLEFYDSTENSYRSLYWDNTLNSFMFEDKIGNNHIIPEKASQLEVNAGQSTKYVTGETLQALHGDTTRRGMVELSTVAETITGASETLATTPKSVDATIETGAYTGVPPLSAFTVHGGRDIIFDRTTGVKYYVSNGAVIEFKYNHNPTRSITTTTVGNYGIHTPTKTAYAPSGYSLLQCSSSIYWGTLKVVGVPTPSQVGGTVTFHWVKDLID